MRNYISLKPTFHQDTPHMAEALCSKALLLSCHSYLYGCSGKACGLAHILAKEMHWSYLKPKS